MDNSSLERNMATHERPQPSGKPVQDATTLCRMQNLRVMRASAPAHPRKVPASTPEKAAIAYTGSRGMQL